MIIKVPKEGITNYELKYFFEADTSRRKNIRKITLSGSGKAFINGNELNDDKVGLDTDEMSADDSQDETPENESDTDNIDDNTDTDIDVDDDIAIDGDDIDLDDEEDLESNISNENTPSEDENDTAESEVALDDSDEGVETDTSNDAATEQAPDKEEYVQKSALFQDFQTMHESLGKYVEKINMLIAYNTDSTTAYKVICDHLDELRDYIYEYMLVKFASSTYVRSLFFYQTALTSLYLILDELEAVKVDSDADEAKVNNDRKHNSKSKGFC